MAPGSVRPTRLALWSGWGLALVAPVAVTVLLNVVGGPKSRDYAFLYLGLVAIMAVTYGLWPSLVTAVASFLLVDYFFVPPYYTFNIADEQDLVNLVVLLGAAVVVGSLGSLRRRAQLRSELLTHDLQAANLELERLNREQTEAAQVALRLAVTEEQVRSLEASDRARRDFLANVSHDLRTPIATILTETTTMAEDPGVPPQAKASLDAVAGEARRLNRVVADMLDMARIEGNALDLHLEPVDIDLALASAAERLGRLARDRTVALPGRVSDGLVLADWGRLGQILDNLLGNADRAAPPGSPITIEVSVSPDEGLVTVRIRDEGPGIPSELGERVFERFVRVEGGGGTGLGLAIVRGLVEAQGGRVWIEGPGPGATIALSLPMVESPG